jgi:hypothetical protein
MCCSALPHAARWRRSREEGAHKEGDDAAAFEQRRVAPALPALARTTH